MKKFFILFFALLVLTVPVFASTDKMSQEYLKGKKHFSPVTFIAENTVEKVLEKALKKNTKSDFDVKIKAYNLSSMKEGIFKYAEFNTKDLVIEEIPIAMLNIKTDSDYNWIDYRENPIICKSDMVYSYTLHLTEDSINQALKHKEYYKTLQKVNQRAYPLFTLHDVKIKTLGDKVRIMMDYSLPLAQNNKVKSFSITTDFVVNENIVKAYNVTYDKAYGNLGEGKVANLINLLDPLSFTLKLLNTKKCNTRIENVKIIDNIIQINGKIYVKAEG